MEQMMNQNTNMEMNMDTGAAKKQGKGMMFGMIACAILAVGGIGFGIYEMSQVKTAKQQIADLKIEVKKDDGSTTTIETDKIEVKEADKTVVITDSAELTSDSFIIQGMGIKIKNLATPRFYSYSTEPHGPADPTSSITLGYGSSIPKLADGTPLGTDSLPVYNIATIYQYNEQYFFNHEEKCDVELGKIGELNYCIQKLDCSETCESQVYSEEIKQSWRNAFNETSDNILKILSDPSNYSAI